ncbi:MAG: hypothetical protein CBC13_02115 [Planctomycetia bacterium TMED53]|nr:MAG: hypothetical protein CBC13_02115 [Planctomycetia bacterium TMED53]
MSDPSTNTRALARVFAGGANDSRVSPWRWEEKTELNPKKTSHTHEIAKHDVMRDFTRGAFICCALERFMSAGPREKSDGQIASLTVNIPMKTTE